MNRSIIGIVLGVVATGLFGCTMSGQSNPSAQGVTPGNRQIGISQSFGLTARSRPVGVPPGFVATPDGWFHPSCILELHEGDRLNRSTGAVELATGGRRAIAACAYPSYTPSGRVRSSSKFPTPRYNFAAPEPNGWQVSETSYPGNIGQLSANWQVPWYPPTQTPEVDYFFPGIENSGPTTYIAQPVLAWGYNGLTEWTIASWFCCINGNNSHGGIFPVSPRQTITGTITGSGCNSSTGVCATWNVNTVSGGASSGFTVTAFNEPMIFEAGGALESYYVTGCAQYSSDAGLLFHQVTAYGVNGAVLTPTWSENIDPSATCHESGSTSGGSSVDITLNWWPANLPRPNTPSTCGLLTQGQGLASSGPIPGTTVLSCNGSYKLVMQTDGNLVLYQGVRSLWSTGTNGTSAYFAEMQTDGNFVLYDALGNAKWASGTAGNPGAHLAIQNAGNLVIYSSSGTVLWVN